LLEIIGLQVNHGWVRALRDLSLHIHKGEMVAVIGANGAGKSTLLGALAGLYKPAGGRILLNGRSVTGKPAESGADFKKNLLQQKGLHSLKQDNRP
jgi:branched-chain amino acid transport system ATP-binding protein